MEETANLMTVDELDVVRKQLALWRCETDVLRFIVKKISSDKESGQTWKNYIMKKSNLRDEDWKKTMKNFYIDDHEKFNMSECDDFDITFLCKLIPFLSDKVEKRNSDTWKKIMEADDKESYVEYSLSSLTAIRNEIQHEERSERRETDKLLKSMKTSIESLLNSAEKKLDIDPDEISNKKQDIQLKFQALEMLTKEDYKLVLDVRNRIEFKKRLRKDINRHNVVRPPFQKPSKANVMSVMSVFSPLLLKVHSDCDAEKRIIKSNELLSSDKDYSFIVGPPGAGKTTLMKVILNDWIMLNGNDPCTFKRLNEFDIVLLIECRKQGSQLTFINALKHQFPDTFAGVSENDSIRRAVDQLEVLIIFDGYDECNKNSASLINDLLDQKWHFNNVKVIFTSRPGTHSTLVKKLSEERCQVAEIENVADELAKEEYIKKYETALETENMLTTFNGLDHSVTDAMTTPKDLALFAWLYSHEPKLVRDWTSDFDVVDSLVQIIKKNIFEKAMNDHHLEYPNKVTTDVLNLVSVLCLTLFTNNKFTLSEEEREIFCLKSSSENQILVQVKDEIWQEFLSNIVVSYATGDEKHEYSFYHTSLQEVLASKSIVRDFKTMKKTSFSESVQRLTGLEIDRYDRFSNIIKYVILMFNKDDLISKYRELLVDMIKNVPLEGYDSYSQGVVRASGNNRTVEMLMFQATPSSQISSTALTAWDSDFVQRVSDISRQVLVHIAKLLTTDKDPRHTLKEYIDLTRNINLRKYCFDRIQLVQLRNTTFDDLDIFTLYNIIPVLTDEIVPRHYREFPMRISNETTFEYWLKRVKDMNSKFIHDFRFGFQLMKDEAEHILLNLLYVSLDTFNFNPDKVRTLMNNVTEQLKPMIN